MWLYARGLTDGARLGLVAKRVDDFGRGADEGDARLLDLARELCVFGEEAVSARGAVSRPRGRAQGAGAYPGWIMSTPCWSAMRMMSSCAR